MKDKIIKLAQGEVGYLEKSKDNYMLYGANCLYPKIDFAGADNYTKYAYELYNAGLGHKNGYAWCQTFIAWLFWKTYGADLANQLLCGMLSSASTMDVKNAMINAGRQVPLNKAQAGDIVYRSRSGGGHVGLVIGRSSDGKIITIEGNSSASDITSWNGGAVVQHTGASWEWCCRPDYSIIDYHWIQDNGKWYYQNGLGQNWHGWGKIKETAGPYWHWYWFDAKGAAATGAVEIDGKWYFFWPGDDKNQCMECLTNANGEMEIWSMTE